MAGNPYTPSPPTVFFVNPEFIKSVIPMTSNIDDNVIKACTATAQHKWVMPIIGSTLCGQLLDLISGGTLMTQGTAAQIQLVNEFLVYIAAWAVGREIIPFIHYQVRNKGVEVRRSEFSNPAQRSDINFLIDIYKNNFEYYAKRATLWVLDNVNQPGLQSYASPGPYMDIVNPNYTSTSSPLYIPGNTRNSQGPGSSSLFGLGLTFEGNSFDLSNFW